MYCCLGITWGFDIERACTYLSGLLEPPLLVEGKKRAHWGCVSLPLLATISIDAQKTGNTCVVKLTKSQQRCGHQLYDDFYETQPGAVKRLEQRLNGRNDARKPNSSDHNDIAGSMNGKSGRLNSILHSMWFPWNSTQKNCPHCLYISIRSNPDEKLRQQLLLVRKTSSFYSVSPTASTPPNSFIWTFVPCNQIKCSSQSSDPVIMRCVADGAPSFP